VSPEISVVIATYNRASQLERALAGLAAQTLDPARFEVVVMDDGSSDATADVLARARPYRLLALRQENAGPGAARNAAIRAAQGDLVVFIDDDVIPDAGLVEAHLRAQRSGPVAAIGPMLPPADGARQPVWSAWELRMLKKQYDSMSAGRWAPTPRQFYTANASVPRGALLRAGLFDTSFLRAEDMELAYRLQDGGLPFRFVPEARVIHDTPRTLAGWLRLGADYGRYDVAIARQDHREHMIPMMASECRTNRHAALRALARLTAGRGAPMRCVRLVGPVAIRATAAVGFERLSFAVCSIVFNLQYWDAVCRALGRDPWWAAVDRAGHSSERLPA